MASASMPVPRGRPGRKAEPSRFVIVSGYHDYRTKRRANLHFVADELAQRGAVFFLSVRYSLLTRLTEDPRHDLWNRANRVETVNGVTCFLARTLIHPFRMPPRLAMVERVLFGLFARRLPRAARTAVADADMIFVESGIGLVLLPAIRRLNPKAEVVYLASDSLAAINQADTIKTAFQRHAAMIDLASLPSPLLRSDVPAAIPCRYVPHGIEKARFAAIGPSPYEPGTKNAVSVGSMLFDADFFRRAARLFPDVTFHVIGTGHGEPIAANVVLHPEMPFEATLPFIKHADVAVAAYGPGVEPYLTHTSMKLMQYGYLGVPAVCPFDVAGTKQGRFGYRRGDDASIRSAVEAALRVRDLPGEAQLGWDEVADRWVHPDAFPDTALEGAAEATVGLAGQAAA